MIATPMTEETPENWNHVSDMQSLRSLDCAFLFPDFWNIPFVMIQILLQVNVGVDFLRDPCIEILQYEKYQEKILSTEKRDQCGALLKWILPLDNTLPFAARLLSPLLNSGIGNTSQRSNSSASLVSQFIFNVASTHVPDIVIFVDSITIVFEEATKSGPPSSLPIACIEAGNGHSLPNLALR
ncbi:hypothetical protein JHK85_006443 [Glycine max]|nr:hypothetical protein JHK85_006443 [Glycine max]